VNVFDRIIITNGVCLYKMSSGLRRTSMCIVTCFAPVQPTQKRSTGSRRAFQYANVMSFEQWLSLEGGSSERPGENRVS
jgi:hypothetical protein